MKKKQLYITSVILLSLLTYSYLHETRYEKYLKLDIGAPYEKAISIMGKPTFEDSFTGSLTKEEKSYEHTFADFIYHESFQLTYGFPFIKRARSKRAYKLYFQDKKLVKKFSSEEDNFYYSIVIRN